MDPLTHGLLGAATAQALQAVTQKKIGKRAALAGALAAMAPDLDVLSEFAADPTVGLLLHRHFTHSLLFIPLGALIVALVLRIFKSYRSDWGGVYLACLIGYATHGLLDACTSYGTMLLWPISDARISWDSVSIVDPVVTFVLLVGVVWARLSARSRPAVIALALCALYLVFGEVQNRRAESGQREIARLRGHTMTRSRVMTTLANLVVWRSIYEAEGRLWADAIRVSPWTGATFQEGASVTVFTAEALPPGFLENPALKEGWERFVWFTEGFMARIDREDVVCDMRYSSETSGFKPLWGMVVPEDSSATHVGWTYFRRNRKEALQRLWRDLF